MDKIESLKQLLADAERIVAFTGAGISTESGIPDFRSPGGIWSRMKPIEFGNFLASDEARRESWRRKFASEATMRAATPNAGHRALVRLYEQGKLQAVITQNIDGLHQASGLPDTNVIELHGNGTYAACLQCAQRYELEWVREIFSAGERLPVCRSCGGIVKTATISFGQSMPEAAMEQAHEVTRRADLFVVLGSSLVVYPAAGFPILAKRNGARLAIVNRDATEQDAIADLVVHDEIGPTLSRAVGAS